MIPFRGTKTDIKLKEIECAGIEKTCQELSMYT